MHITPFLRFSFDAERFWSFVSQLYYNSPQMCFLAYIANILTEMT